MVERAQTVGLALIARDEQENLPYLLKSIEGAFDRVTLLDTGSVDSTIKVFQKWACKQKGMTFSVGTYKWIDDFADARNKSDALLIGDSEKPMVDWTCWADCDDEIIGAANIKPLCNQAPAGVAAFLIDYDYTQHPETGACLQHLRRERMVRSSQAGRWAGRVHEAQIIESGAIQPVAPALLHWRHRKGLVAAEDASQSNGRNLRILEAWLADEPDNPRVLSYLGVENALRGDHEVALDFYDRYLAIKTDWDEERAQVLRRKSASLLGLDRFEEVIDTGLTAMRVLPDWPDNYISLAEAYLGLGEFEKSAKWAKLAVDRGAPERTLLITNPLDYAALPLKILALALGGLGDYQQAIDVGMRGLEAFPDQGLRDAVLGWQTIMKRERTAETFVMCAEQLVAHDEQLKAMEVIDSVPVFAWDHPRVVAYRSFLRERLMWVHSPAAFADHYEYGGSKPEDFVADDQVDALCEYLPRTQFLLHGLKEQIDGE